MGSALLQWFSNDGSPGDTIRDVAVKGTLILVCGLVAAVASRRGSAASRHYVWGVTLVATLALPILGSLLPRWGLPIGWTYSATGAGVMDTSSAYVPGELGGPDWRASLLSTESREAQDVELTQRPSAEGPVSGAAATKAPSTGKVGDSLHESRPLLAERAGHSLSRRSAERWDLENGRLMETLEGPSSGSLGIYAGGFAFTAAGIRLATPGISDKKVSFWDMNNGNLMRQFQMAPIDPERAAVSPDGQWVAAAPRFAARISVWNAKTGMEVAQVAVGHEYIVNDVVFSPDGKTIVTASDDGTVRTWRADQQVQQHVLRHDYIVRGVAVSPDGKWIASNSNDNTVRLSEAATGNQVRRLVGHGRLGGLRPVSFSADGRRIHTWGDDDMKLRVWDLAGNFIHQWDVPPAEVLEWQVPPNFAARSREDARKHGFPFFWTTDLSSAQFSPDGRLLVPVLRLGVYLFEVETGEEVRMIAAQAIPQSAAVAPDGKTLVVAERRSSKTVISLYELTSGHDLFALTSGHDLFELTSGHDLWHQELPDEDLSLVNFSPDGQIIAAAAKHPGGKIHVLDAGTGRLRRTVGSVPTRLCGLSLRFSPDSRLLACGTHGGAVLFWDLPRLGLQPD